jgi:hypothetical protein
MATLTLYLNNTATASPFPTTSKGLVTTAPASEVSLGPGEWDSGFPGAADAGQWNPSSPIADTTAAAEIDDPGATLGTTRQGWLYGEVLTGKRLTAGDFTVQLRLNAVQGSGTSGSVMMRVTVVTGSAGAWVTVANLLTTDVVGGSPSTGQTGWRAAVARINVTSTTANFTNTVTTGAEHVFAENERLLIELGFGDGNSTTDRTWRLDYNTSNSFITTPNIVDVKNTPRIIKPVRPVPYRSNSLWRGCKFALATGWPKGARSGTTFAETDDQSGSRGGWTGALGSENFVITDAGRMLNSDGTSDDDHFDWTDVGGRYAITQSFTAAVLVRPSIIDTAANATKAVFAKATTVWSVTTISWNISINKDAGSVWIGEFFDASNNFYGVGSNVIPSIGRTDFIVVRYDRPNNSLKIWVNGELRGTLAPGIPSVAVRNNSAWPLRVASPEITGNNEFKVGMQAFWDRAITDQEIARLSADPFTMWKTVHREFFISMGAGILPPLSWAGTFPDRIIRRGVAVPYGEVG